MVILSTVDANDTNAQGQEKDREREHERDHPTKVKYINKASWEIYIETRNKLSACDSLGVPYIQFAFLFGPHASFSPSLLFLPSFSFSTASIPNLQDHQITKMT